MAIRNPKREELRQLASKTLDAKFKTTIHKRLNCSPFEAEAVLDVVHEVYTPFLDAAAGTAPPGKVTLLAVSADEPAGKAVVDCEKVAVCLTLHRGAEDDALIAVQRPGRLSSGTHREPVSRGHEPGGAAHAGRPGLSHLLRERANHLARLGGVDDHAIGPSTQGIISWQKGTVMIDAGGDGATILSAGREDRALAEEQPERSRRCRDRRGSPPPWQALAPPACSGLKAINLGVWGRAPRQHPGPVGHMSRSTGLDHRFELRSPSDESPGYSRICAVCHSSRRDEEHPAKSPSH